jgi:hypothetical protein
MDQSPENLLGQYFQKLPEALLKFQFIEELLRMYISHCYQIIFVRTSQQIPFKYEYKDLQKDALGALLRKFKRFSDNNTLIGKIENIIKDRNYCAHEAYLLTYAQQNDPGHLRAEIEKMETIITKAEDCRQLLSAEVKQLEAIRNSINESKS